MARFHVAILLLVAVVGSIQCCDHETKAVTELEAKELGQFSCNGKPDGNYPDPGDSSHYWQCYDGQRYYKICSENMHFDNKARRCVPGSPSREFNCYGKSDGNYQDPGDSSHYWQCVDGQRYHKICPENMHFNNKARRCVPGSPSEAQCAEKQKASLKLKDILKA